MAQFTVYRSSDFGAPVLFSATGSVLTVLDACLVNGYGNQPAAGWFKPIANSGSVANTSSYGCYQQPTGSGFYLFINDNAPNQSALFREAWATGWENLVSLSSSITTSNGSGSGQFPLPNQSLVTGHVVIRKSSGSEPTSSRQWVVAADSSSFYLFIATNDTGGMYYGFAFGDIYSYKNPIDSYKCIIIGRLAENTAAAVSDGFDTFTSLNLPTVGNYMPRSYVGTGTSIQIEKHGDGVKGTTYFSGSIPFPNGTDAALYLSPIWVVEPSGSVIRGQLRGLYQPLHSSANFVDGQTFSGSLDYTGKTFQVIKTSPNNGMFVIETSNTLATN